MLKERLEICANGHPAVVHAHDRCPMCAAESEIAGLSRAVTILQRELDEAQNGSKWACEGPRLNRNPSTSTQGYGEDAERIGEAILGASRDGS